MAGSSGTANSSQCRLKLFLKKLRENWEKELVDAIKFIGSSLRHKVVESAELKAVVHARPDQPPDIMDYLCIIFKFQEGNVKNQRDHILHLLMNAQLQVERENPGHKPVAAKPDGALQIESATTATDSIEMVANRTLENYDLWFEHSKRWLPGSRPHDHERTRVPNITNSTSKLLSVCLYLLIWGEAANLRFMPECLCFIFYQMHEDLFHTKDVAKDRFLDVVVKPVYRMVRYEATGTNDDKAKLTYKTKISHTSWSNYDDFNELFWSEKCLPLFEWGDKQFQNLKNDPVAEWKEFVKTRACWPIIKNKRKVNFVERRTFVHIFHSFHRMWIMLILVLQGMVIFAFSNKDMHKCITYLLSLGPSHALLMFIQCVCDIGFTWGAQVKHVVRLTIQFLFYAFATSVLTFLYVKTVQNRTSEDDSVHFKAIYVVVLASYGGAHVAHGLGYILVSCFMTDNKILKWNIFKERYFIGHNIRAHPKKFPKYATFWIILLAAKFFVSYMWQIKPLVNPTRQIINLENINYVWHDFISKKWHNLLTVASLWTPVILIYLLDVQIWYIVFSGITGFLVGGFTHLGEIRSLGMFVNQFPQLPDLFVKKLVSKSSRHDQSKRNFEAKVFVHYWNELVKDLWDGHYLSNEEHELLLMPTDQDLEVIQWPLFILINEVGKAKSLKPEEILQKFQTDPFTRYAIKNIYCIVEKILNELVGDIRDIFELNEETIRSFQETRNKFLRGQKFPRNKHFNHSQLGEVIRKVELLEAAARKSQELKSRSETKRAIDDLIFALAQFLETKARDNLQEWEWKEEKYKDVEGLFVRLSGLLHRLPTQTVPRNHEAQRRLLFFANSLRMKMPPPPLPKEMLSFSVFTPYLDEEVQYGKDYLIRKNKDGISNLYYLQRVYEDEWQNFERREPDIEGFKGVEIEKWIHEKEILKHVRLWASYRGQTLARTVRGMMQYHRALKLQHELEGDKSCSKDCNCVPDLKFTYVVSCQKFGEFEKSAAAIKRRSRAATEEEKSRADMANDIKELMKKNPALKVAYIDENEGVFTSKLIAYKKDSSETDQYPSLYSIELPGQFFLGEGKPENQNHAIIFTRGDALQTIDMNQDNYFEEALKMRNLLEEFKLVPRGKPYKAKVRGNRRTILGVREHIFTGSVSSLAWFMSNQETSFVTLGQRVMAMLNVRMHYGHPDVFDRIFHITRGGISKASRTINLSEDIFAGFNTTLRGGNVTHHEYIQVGKGRDLGLNQISAFEAKVSSGNGEQILSRDLYRLGRFFDFFRMLSFYYTSVGYYVTTMLTVWALYLYLYGKVYLALSGVEASIVGEAAGNNALAETMSSQFLFQIGIFNCIPMLLGYVLERGVLKATQYFVSMSILGAYIFFAFSLATRTHYFGRTLLHGGAKYRKTGRGFVIEHIQFAENYRFYSRSHFIKGLEIAMLLTVYACYGKPKKLSYLFITVNNWFLAFCWLYAPFIFNPLGFEWQKTVEDISNWNSWLSNRTSNADHESWKTWWNGQTELTDKRGCFVEILLSLRFFVIQYGVVYHLRGSHGNTSLKVYGISWVLFFIVAVMLAFFSLSRNSGNRMRFWHAVASILLVVAFVIGCFFTVQIQVMDVLASILVLVPTGWAILCIAVAFKTILKKCKLWWIVETWAWYYDGAMGYLIFAPVIFLSWFPFISPLHTRLLYNQAFSRGLEISRLVSEHVGKPPEPQLQPSATIRHRESE